MNLESLIYGRLEGELSPEQLEQLENLLRSDWQARRLYLELADQHARLLQQPQIATGRLQSVASSSSNARPHLHPTAILISAAAAIAAALVIAFWPRPQVSPEATSSGVATLSQTLDAQFAQTPLLSGDTLAPGIIKLAKGLAQIEFFSGATLLMEGGSEVEIVSAWEVRCTGGRVRVHVPPAATGFLMHAPDLKLEDLGTEFALNVSGARSAVHVFEGEVIAHSPVGAPTSLTEGMSLGSASRPVAVDDFLAIGELQSLVRQREARRYAEWQAWSQEARKDPRLIVYYTFKHWQSDLWDRMINNFASPRLPRSDGGAVGARWTRGRWPEKEALEFKRPGDRVRLHLGGTYQALTLACWVKVDAVDKKYNSLLLTDGYENGEPHWQIHEDGSLMFSIIYRPGDATEKGGKWNQMYFSKPVFTSDSLGRWHHLAVTYENRGGEVIQYFDGMEVSREISALHQPGRAITLGACEMGNWGLPTQGHQFPIRNLNGSIDEFAIYSEALPPEDIQSLFEAGKVE